MEESLQTGQTLLGANGLWRQSTWKHVGTTEADGKIQYRRALSTAMPLCHSSALKDDDDETLTK